MLRRSDREDKTSTSLLSLNSFRTTQDKEDLKDAIYNLNVASISSVYSGPDYQHANVTLTYFRNIHA